MALASVLGNLWDWVAGVFTRIGDVSPYWQDSILTIWNVLLGIVVMLWAFGWHQMRDLLSKSRRRPAHEPAAL